LKRPLQLYLEERFIMMLHEEVIAGLIRFGRGNVQDFIARSSDVNDVVTYLWVELGFNLARLLSFETTDLVTFKKNNLAYTLYQAKDQNHQSISQNIIGAKKIAKGELRDVYSIKFGFILYEFRMSSQPVLG
jgi:hypothetical protein